MKQQDAHKKLRITQKWRKPRGSDSKMRRNLRGYSSGPSSGLRAQRDRRGTLDGLQPVFVSNLNHLEGIDKDSQIVVFSGVGMRKKMGLVEEAQKRNLKMHNVGKDYLASCEEVLKQRKEQKKRVQEKRRAKQVKKEVKKKEEKKEVSALEEAVSDEAKKKEKQEKDKLLTKKDVK